MLNGKEIAADWTAGYAEDAVVISQLNDEHVTDGTAAKAAELEKNLRAGNAKVFNTEKFTIDGSSLDTLATSNTNFKKYKKYIKNGNLQESMTQSKSIFDTLSALFQSLSKYKPPQNCYLFGQLNQSLKVLDNRYFSFSILPPPFLSKI